MSTMKEMFLSQLEYTHEEQEENLEGLIKEVFVYQPATSLTELSGWVDYHDRGRYV